MTKLVANKRSVIKIEKNITTNNKKEIVNRLKEKLRQLKFSHINPQNIEDDLLIYKNQKHSEKRIEILVFFGTHKISTSVKESLPIEQIRFQTENNYLPEEIPVIIKNIQFLQEILNK